MRTDSPEMESYERKSAGQSAREQHRGAGLVMVSVSVLGGKVSFFWKFSGYVLSPNRSSHINGEDQ